MKKHEENLRSVGLFQGIPHEDLLTMLECLGAEIREHKKGELLLAAGSKPEFVGVLLAGELHIFKDDVDGNRILLSAMHSAGIFAEALCCAGATESPVSVIAASDAEVMRLSFSRILFSCPNSCGFHHTLIANMLRLIARKNLYLQDRLELIRMKSVRAKILGYLATFAPGRGQSFLIPFNREEMASFLCVERSALSHELARMKADGLIEFRKNRFMLK